MRSLTKAEMLERQGQRVWVVSLGEDGEPREEVLPHLQGWHTVCGEKIVTCEPGGFYYWIINAGMPFGFLAYDKEEGSQVMKYRKKARTVDAVQFVEGNMLAVLKFVPGISVAYDCDFNKFVLSVRHSDHHILCDEGDYLIRMTMGGIRAVSREEFEREYEKA